MLIAALRDHPAGGLRRERLIEAGLTVEAARTARRFEWDAKAKVNLARMSWQDAKRALERQRSAIGMIPRFAALWHAVEDLLIDDGPPASGRAVIGDYEIDGTTVRAVRLFGAEQIAAGWRRTPTLHIDATVDMDAAALPRAACRAGRRGRGRRAAYAGRAVPGQSIRQVRAAQPSASCSRSGIGPSPMPRAQAAIGASIAAERSRGSRSSPRARCRASFKLHHFGALRGLDELRDVRGLIVVGRPMASPGEVERIAGALSGRAVEAVAGDWYPAEIVQLRARDGSVATVEADRHPDPLAEAVRASIAEGELLQSIGRARGLNRTEADPGRGRAADQRAGAGTADR